MFIALLFITSYANSTGNLFIKEHKRLGATAAEKVSNKKMAEIDKFGKI
jgi:hypothetical protein